MAKFKAVLLVPYNTVVRPVRQIQFHLEMLTAL